MEFVFRKDLLDMTLANGDERSSWPMRWSWQDEIDEFKILCTFLYKDWILFPGWKDGVSCIMHIRPPHQCQDVLHDQPDIPSPLVQCINKLFMFAIVLDTHVEILFISGDPEGGLSITLYPPLSIVFASSYWKVLMILVNIILKTKHWGSLLIWSIARKLGNHPWSSSPTHFWKIGKPRQEKGQNIEHQCPVHLIYHHSKSWFWENTFWHHHENTCLGMMGLDWGCLLNHF